MANAWNLAVVGLTDLSPAYTALKIMESTYSIEEGK